MRLAMICTEKLPVPPVRGGAIQAYIAGVAPLLAQRHQVTVFGVTDRALPAQEERDGVHHVRLPARGYPDHVARALRSRDFDVVSLFNRPKSVAAVRAACPRAALVLSMHNDMFLPEKIRPAAARECLEQVAAVVTVSDYVGREILRLYPAAGPKLHTVYSAADPDIFVPGWAPGRARRRRRLRRRLGLSGRQVVLNVGRLSDKKGAHVLIRAMGQLARSHPRAVLVVVGSKWYGGNDFTDDYVRRVYRMARALGRRVRLAGFVPYGRMPDWYLVADVFTCASQWQEPLARVHYEAMAAGLPIVTTARGGNAEVMEPGGNGLVLAPPNHKSPAAFARAVGQLLDDPARARRMGVRSRELVLDRFHWHRVADELDQLYRQVAPWHG